MSWQLYHENIMASINDSKIGTAFRSLFSSVTCSNDHLGLVVAGTAALNGAMTIMSVLSARYGDYTSEGRLARFYYDLDGYTAIGYGMISYYIVAGEDYLSAVAYGCLPVTLFLLRFLSLERMRNYPDKAAYMGSVATVFVACLLIACSLSGKGNPKLFMQIMSTLGVAKSVTYIFLPARILSKVKYSWDPKSNIWAEFPKCGEIDHREATIAAIVDYGHTRLTFNSLVVALSFGMDSLSAVGLSALVHAACLAQSLMYPTTKTKIYAIPKEIYLGMAVFVGWNLFLVEP